MWFMIYPSGLSGHMLYDMFVHEVAKNNGLCDGVCSQYSYDIHTD